MRLTLRARILAVYLVALVAFLAALAYGLLQVRGNRELTRVQELWIPLSQEVGSLRNKYPLDLDALEKEPPATRRIRAGQFPLLMQHFREVVAAAQQKATLGLKAAEGPAAPRMTNLVTSLGKLSEPASQIVPALQAYLAALEKGDRDAVDSARVQVVALDRRIRDGFDDASRAVDQGLRTDATAARAKTQSALFALTALTVLATVFGLVAIAIVGRALAPVGDLIAGAKRISAGDFDRRIDVGSEGTEIAALATEFNTMAESLRSRDERLRLLAAFNENVLESVRVGIVVADGAGVITGVNRAAEEIWGLARAELLGKPLATLAPAAGKEGGTVVERVETVRAGNPPVRLGAVAFANQRMVEVSAVPFLASGKASGVVVVAEDVTERVRVEQALLRSEKLAAIGRMSSQITHEVRNPLNSLSLNVEMLQEELSEEKGEARELLGAIAGEIDRLTEITEGYLGFARLPRPHLEREQVNSVVESLLRFVHEEAEKAGVRVTPELGESLPDVLADENQLRQALLNVVRNSLDAMRTNGSGRSGGTLAVSTRKAGAQVEVIVRDDGPGIAPKDLARIFDPFYSTKTEGTGLGLPLTQQIIEEHGGTIACASEPGRGTIFTIRLPAADGPV